MVNWIYEQDSENKKKSLDLLKRCKAEETESVLYAKRINKNTIVKCKRIERLKEYENL